MSSVTSATFPSGPDVSWPAFAFWRRGRGTAGGFEAPLDSTRRSARAQTTNLRKEGKNKQEEKKKSNKANLHELHSGSDMRRQSAPAAERENFSWQGEGLKEEAEEEEESLISNYF